MTCASDRPVHSAISFNMDYYGGRPHSVPYGSTGWDIEILGTWNGMRIEYFVFQPLADVATAAEVVEALSGVTDGNLATNITNVRSVRGHSP